MNANSSGPVLVSSVRKTRWAWTLATWFGVGWMHPGPGTWASATVVVLWWALTRVLPAAAQPWVAAGLAAVFTVVGISASNYVVRESGRKDPGFVVIDEVAGQMIALIAAPASWKYLIAGFILFRVFDIVKPFPVRRLESMPEGTGVMMDDIGAGVYALLLLQIWLRFVSPG